MNLLDSVLSGVGQAGEAVDKVTGGRALRGLAAGKPRELLSALPFSDTLGVTDERDKTSGRDVTDTWGLTSKGDTSFGSHALGFGADMALNPLGLFGAGAAAKAAPTLGKGLAAGAKALSGVDLLESVGGKLKGFRAGAKRFAENESGALHLPYDGIITPKDAGLLRSDPKWVNNRTFYHGTGKPDLVSSTLDPFATRPDSLAGAGVYTTDAPEIARGYAKARSKRTGTPTVYQSQSDFRNILDMDEAPSAGVRSIYSNAAGGLKGFGYGIEDFPDLQKAVETHSSTPLDLHSALASAASEISHADQIPDYEMGELFHNLAIDLKGNANIDALTHTGGLRTRAGRAHGPHQVVVGIDPNDTFGFGARTPYKQWEAIKGFFGDESGALRPDSLLKWLPFGDNAKVNPAVQNAAAWIGPQHKGGVEQLADLIKPTGNLGTKMAGNDLKDALLTFSGRGKVASELEEGSQFVANGAEGMVFKNRGGDSVVRMAPEKTSLGAAARADIPEILQPYRHIVIPGSGRESPWRIEHLPWVDPINPGGDANKIDSILQIMQAEGHPDFEKVQGIRGLLSQLYSGSDEAAYGLRASIAANPEYGDLFPSDFHGGNVSMTREGNVIGHDGGMVRAAGGLPPIQRNSPTQPRMVEDLQQAMKLGAPDVVREMLEKGRAAGTAGQGMASLPDVDIAGLANAQAQAKNFLSQYGHIKRSSYAPEIRTAKPKVNVEALLNNLFADLRGIEGGSSAGLLAMLGVPAAAGYAYQGN